MRNLLSYFILATALVMTAAFAAVGYMTEYTKTGKCYRTNSILNTEDMRERVYISLLATEMLMSVEDSTDKLDVKTFLIPKSLTKEEVIDAIQTKSIIDLPTQAMYSINSHEEIKRLDPKIFRNEFSVVAYGMGYATITPSNGLTVAPFDDAKRYLDSTQKNGFVLSRLQRALGYGVYHYQLKDRWVIDLLCCQDRDKRSSYSEKSPEWHSRQMIKSIKEDKKYFEKYLVVSNCGEILHYKVDGMTSFTY